MDIILTEAAVKEIKRVMEEQKMPTTEYVLDVSVVGSGCSGFSYKLGFKSKSEIDALNEIQFNFDGLEASINNKSLLYLKGTTIDHHVGLNAKGFVFNNPNAKGCCGCGSSFSC